VLDLVKYVCSFRVRVRGRPHCRTANQGARPNCVIPVRRRSAIPVAQSDISAAEATSVLK
jgi:hypothetical protein